jgi:hypothetical protein
VALVAELGIEVEVYRHSDPFTKVEVLNGRINPSSLDEIGGNGGGDLSLHLTDPKIVADPTLIAYRNVLKIKVVGKVVGAMVIGKNSKQIIDDSPEGEVYKISGEGLRTWLGTATVYPQGGLKKTSFDERAFNFSSEQGFWYHASDWKLPVNLRKWGDDPNSIWRYMPAEWPDAPDAWWVWSQYNDGGIPAPTGDNYFRYEFDVAVARQYSFFLAADNSYTLYVDGQMVSQSDPKTGGSFLETTRIDQPLEVGHHIISVRVNNLGGPAGLLAALFYYGDPAVPSSAVLVSYTGKTGDNAWRVLGYPNPVPGWTPGEVLLTLLSEAEERGVRAPSWLTANFTVDYDSYGVPWERGLDWSFGIGDKLSSVVEKLEELVCDVWIDPDTLTLNMATKRGVDRSVYRYAADGVTVVSAPIVFSKGHNLGSSIIDGVSDIANSLVVSTADGWAEIVDSKTASVSEYGRIEAKLDTGVSSSVSSAVADAVFLQKAMPEEGASYVVIPKTGSIPYVDFQVGDWVLAPNALGTSVKRRVMSIAVEETESGTPAYMVEFDTIFQDNEEKLDAWLQKLGGGSLGGQFSNSGGGSGAPIGTPTVTGPSATPIIQFPQAPTNLEASSVGLWSANGVEAYSEVTLTWEAVTLNTDGSPTTPLFYEVWGHLTSDSDYTYERFGQTSLTTATFRPFQAGSEWTFEVRAYNNPNAAGEPSAPVDHVMVGPTAPMDPPDAPVLTSSKGVLQVAWNGLLAGQAPPPQFRYVYAMVAPTAGGVYTRTGATLSRDGRTILISGLTIGATYWVKLAAVDGVGIVSPESTAVSNVILGIDLGDLDVSVGNAIDAAHDAALAARSMNNMLNGGSFEENDPALWSLETANVTNVAAGPNTGLRALRVVSTTAEYYASKYGLVLEVAPGETYQFAGWVRAGNVGATHPADGITLALDYGTSSTTLTSYVDVAGSPIVSGTYVYFSGNWTVPAGVRFARPVILSTSLVAGRIFLIDDLTFRMVIPGALVLDGAISADKIGAGAVVAGKISAGAIATENLQAGSVTTGILKAGAVTTNELAAGAVKTNNLDAGAVTTSKLAAEVGKQLDISSNTAINLIVGQIEDVASDQQATAGSLQTMQTYYQFGPNGAIISSPSSPFQLALRADRIEMLELNVPVSYWNAGQMFVRSFVGEEVILGNHKLEKYGTGTVVRTL